MYTIKQLTCLLALFTALSLLAATECHAFNPIFPLARWKQKPSIYYGLGIGSGQGWVQGRSFNYLFNKQEEAWGVGLDRSFKIALNIGVGLVLSEQWQVGLDLSVIRQYIDKKEWGKDQDMSFRINNYMLAARYFPAKSGLSLKVGLGLPGFQERLLREVIHETYKGYAGVVGVGYDFRMDKKLKIGIHADYSYQRYPNQEGPDHTSMLNMYVSFYRWR